MANSISIQKISDGPRNLIVKFEGVLDTSDLATGTTLSLIGGATTSGSTTITYTSNTSVIPGMPISGTNIPAGAYIVSVTSATAAVISAAATGTGGTLTFTASMGNIVLADPALVSAIDNSTGQLATKLQLHKIMFNVEDSLSVNLYWDATTPVRIEELVGRGKMDYKHFGGIPNNAGTGVNGRLTAATQGWAASAILSFSVIVELTKVA